MVWLIVVALVLICVMGIAARRLQGGPSYDGVTVHHWDEDSDAAHFRRVRVRRLQGEDPYEPPPSTAP